MFIKYHAETEEIALFRNDTLGTYWIGEYSPFMTHQSDEPSYVWMQGCFATKEEGLAALEVYVNNG